MSWSDSLRHRLAAAARAGSAMAGGLALMLAAGYALGCGGQGAWVGPVAARAPAPHVRVADVRRYSIAASADAVVQSGDEWRDERLGDLEWLMAGAVARPVFWFAYVRFSVGVLPRDTEVGRAVIQLPVSAEPAFEQGADEAVFAAHRVVGEWSEAEIRWTKQPRVDPRVGGRFRVTTNAEQAFDEIDVTDMLNDAIRDGATSFSIAIVPEDPFVDFRRRWHSHESAGDPESAQPPTLHVVLGVSPPAPREAERAP